MSEPDYGLFPEINPNIDEIIEMDSVLDKDEVVKERDYSQPKKMHNDIFVNQKKNVKIKLKDPTDTITESDLKPKKKRDYSHLTKARAKGAETRRLKAEAKRKLKEEAKEKKEEEKVIRREATKERNRQKARDRYYKQKELQTSKKKNVTKKIVEDTKFKPKFKGHTQPQKPNGMDFNTFARYMMKYEGLKQEYDDIEAAKRIRNQRKKEKNNVVAHKVKPFHPPNYPHSLAKRNNPANRYKEWTGF